MPPLDAVLALLAPPLCWDCGAHAAGGRPLCRRCASALRWLDAPAVLCGVAVWAPLAYEGPARALVGGLKYRGAPRLAAPLAAQIVATAPEPLLSPAAALVPVPLHRARERARGYNQAERLAAALGRRAGMAVADCLRRRGPSRARQVGRGRAERLAGVPGSVAVRAGAAPPARAVLVDDVVTTGATLSACAAALRGAGAEPVGALAYARTPGR